MRILFLGDIVAKSGREAVVNQLPSLKEKYHPDMTIVNGENAAHGKGITAKIYNQLVLAGVDVITLGNHAFSKQDILNHLPSTRQMIRPANMEPSHIGQSYVIKVIKDKKVAVVNLVGKVFMDICKEDPVITMQRLLQQIEADIIIVDFHAEATAEKITFAQYFAQHLTAVLGTHTHVQTADERIIDGCAYISDVGMCGSFDSILGRDIEEVISRSIYNEPTRYTPAMGPAILCGVIIDIDEKTNRANRIERIQIRPKG
ncbi:MAG: TIGR00282 family metallophosphoesterase [Erysipelotrichaceae bacterium]|nr:TIGR00282 family metallophosphoesterase [Erysipelotrichaceae bacterium]MDY6034982.1 TIGR00282 family metallophosphoesterase [Bulleidia sp.]